MFRRLFIGAALAATLAVPGMTGATATAEPVTHGRVVSANPADTTPHVLDGRVRGIATVGSTTVAVGNFTQVREQGSSTTINRSRIFAFDQGGKISTTFVPVVNGSEVFDVIPAGDGKSVYVAGSFQSINGAPRTLSSRMIGTMVPGVADSIHTSSAGRRV